MASPFCTLINGAKMPLFGFGTWLAKPNVVGESVKKALAMGYRHIDCAHFYGNEAEIGNTFTDFFSSGKAKREDVFVTSKLWVSDFDKVREACELTLKNLQLTYLDLYLIHLPFEIDSTKNVFPIKVKGEGIIGYQAERIEEVWKQMESLVEGGKVKSIGVSNFTSQKINNLLKCPLKVQIACNQVELHPYCPQHDLLKLCNENHIQMVAFGPLGNPGRPSFFRQENDPDLLIDPGVTSIATKHQATPAQVLIRYAIERKTGVLVKSVNENRMKENIRSLDVKLDADDMAVLDAITTRHRFCPQIWALKADEEEEDLWDGEFRS